MGSTAVEIVFGLLRMALLSVSTWLIHSGVANQQQIDQVLLGAAGIIVALVWMVAKKFKMQDIVQTALDQPKGSTVEDLNAALRDRRDLGGM